MTGNVAHVHPVGLILTAAVLHVDGLVRLGTVRVISGRQVDADGARDGAAERGQSLDRNVAPCALRRVRPLILDHTRRERCIVLLLRVVRHEHLVESAPGVARQPVGSVDRRVRRVSHPQGGVVVDVEPVLVRAGREGHVGVPAAVAAVGHLHVVAAAPAHQAGLVLRGLVDRQVGLIRPVPQQDVGDESHAGRRRVAVDEVPGVAGRRIGVRDDGRARGQIHLIGLRHRGRHTQHHRQCERGGRDQLEQWGLTAAVSTPAPRPSGLSAQLQSSHHNSSLNGR